MKTTRKDFEKFCKEADVWVKRFQLNDWEIHYVWRDLEDGVGAKTSYDTAAMCAEIALNHKQEAMSRQYEKTPEEYAKHEVIHLLLAPLTDLAESRFCTQDQLTSVEHALVQKLMKLL